MKTLTTLLGLSLISVNAWAGATTVPEPDALALFAIGGVGGLAIWLRSRGKK